MMKSGYTILTNPHLVSKIIYEYKGLTTPSAIAMNADFIEPEPWEDFDIHMKFKAAKDTELVIYRHQDTVCYYLFLLSAKMV